MQHQPIAAMAVATEVQGNRLMRAQLLQELGEAHRPGRGEHWRGMSAIAAGASEELARPGDLLLDASNFFAQL